MGRPEKAIEPAAGPLAAFAHNLRELRRKAGGVRYREMAAATHYSASTLAQAADGRRLPSLAVTLAYVRSCDGDTAEWTARWRELSATVQTCPASAPPAPPPRPAVASAPARP